MSRTRTAPDVQEARTAVAVVFVGNGAVFASLFSRVPDVRAGLGLDNASLGLLLLAAALGSVLSLPTSGLLIGRWGAGAVVRAGAVASVLGVGLAALSVEVLASVPTCAVGLLAYGAGVGMWDVSMNVEGAEVERRLARTVMPRFHAGFSIGGVGGALLGAGALAIGVSMLVHLLLVATVVVVLSWRASLVFAPVPAPPEASDRAPVRPRSAWTEPRTLVVGLMVLCFAVAEGSANDWLSLALIDGRDAARPTAVAGFALFVAAMTLGRMVGPVVLDRCGRAPVLAGSAVLAALGVSLVVLSGPAALVVAGIVCWGLGAALGFPVGMSVAADEAGRSAARLSVVSTIGYAAFLAGPPLLGGLGDAVGTLAALLAVAALMAPALLTVLATRARG